MDLTRVLLATGVGMSLGVALTTHLQTPAEPAKLDAAGIKAMAYGLGYETRELDAAIGKFEIKVASKTLTIPIAFELTKSTNYIWLTVNLGPNSPSKKHEALLKQNASIQPSFFYITGKNNLCAAMAIDNRSVRPTDLKRCIEKLTDDIETSSTVWKD